MIRFVRAALCGGAGKMLYGPILKDKLSGLSLTPAQHLVYLVFTSFLNLSPAKSNMKHRQNLISTDCECDVTWIQTGFPEMHSSSRDVNSDKKE